MKNQLPFCPYCKKRLTYLQAWGIHKDGEYRCFRCGKTSNIRYTKRLKTFAAVASVLGLLIALPMVIFRESIQFGHVFLIVIPFLLFFLLAPFTIVLSPMRSAGKKPVGRAKPSGAFHGNLSSHSAAAKLPEIRSGRTDWKYFDKPQPSEHGFSSLEPPLENDGDFLNISDVSHSDYYSSKYDFSLFEETRRMDQTNNHASVPKRTQARKPAKRRVDPPKKPRGTEEEIDQILQDFIDE